MAKILDITGHKYFHLTAIRLVPGEERKWLFRCDCGNEIIKSAGDVRGGNARSCGCRSRGGATIKRANNGYSYTRQYVAWYGMLERCRNPNHVGYKSYGGRGIKVCERWHKYENFFADMGERPQGASLERIDVNGDYCPENCCWTRKENQSANTTRSKLLTFNGKTANVFVWARELGMDQKLINKRLKSGWSVEDALTIEPGKDSQALQTQAKDKVIIELFKVGKYQVTEYGQIISFTRKKSKILSQGKAPNGYMRVGLCADNGKHIVCFVHRIVALIHLGLPEKFMVVNHKDGNKRNNHISNLEWVSFSENTVHAIKNGLRNAA